MCPGEIEIVCMNENNIDTVAIIERECFSSPWSLASLRSELTNPNAVFYVAKYNGEIAGYAGMHRVLDEGYITNIAVFERHRRSGVASALLEGYIEYAKESAMKMITLEVREGNTAARAFYGNMGFYIAGKRGNFYTKPVENAIIMTLDF